jgi:hypothetical protein
MSLKNNNSIVIILNGFTHWNEKNVFLISYYDLFLRLVNYGEL